MLRLGLTGGAGVGKSTLAGVLAGNGVKVIDTDDLARDLTRPGEGCLDEITAAFGTDLLDEQGQLRRDELARRVFADRERLRVLEAILHPRIRAKWTEQLAMWEAGGTPVACVVIPLLFETGAETAFDRTLCASCTEATQRDRLRARGWSEAQIDGRLAAQLPLKEKMFRSDLVIWTEGAPVLLERQCRSILEQLPAG